MNDQDDKYKVPAWSVFHWRDQDFDALQTMPQLALALEKADGDIQSLDCELSRLKATLQETENKLERATLARDKIRRVMLGLLQETKKDG